MLEEILEKERYYLKKVSFDVKKVYKNRGEKIEDFENVGKKYQKERVKSVIEQMEVDPGLEEACV